MRTLALILFMGISIVFNSCDDASNALPQGQILAKDVTACPCCGGYLIAINNFTYRFFEADLPAGTTLLDGAVFPMDVELKYEAQSDICNGIDRIVIQQIAKK